MGDPASCQDLLEHMSKRVCEPLIDPVVVDDSEELSVRTAAESSRRPPHARRMLGESPPHQISRHSHRRIGNIKLADRATR
jgi:hypothetical protein